MNVTNERVKELMQSNTVTISSVADIRDLCHDILEARETIEKQESIIKEMREELNYVYSQCSGQIGEANIYISNVGEISAILEKTKDYAE